MVIAPLIDKITNISNSFFSCCFGQIIMVNIKLNILNTCTSTNDIAFDAAKNDAEEGSSYLSYDQTNGRGRNNNKWGSLKGNLFLSTILIPKTIKSNWHQLSLLVGYSVLEFLYEMGINKDIIELKWPNDVLVNNKKISGVLLESSYNFIIVGIGLNVLKVPLLEPKWETTKLNDYIFKIISLEDIALKILKKIFLNYTLWESYGFSIFNDKINPYVRNINKLVTLKIPSKSSLIHGIYLGIGDNGGLKIMKDNKIFEYFLIDSFSFSEDNFI